MHAQAFTTTGATVPLTVATPATDGLGATWPASYAIDGNTDGTNFNTVYHSKMTSNTDKDIWVQVSKWLAGWLADLLQDISNPNNCLLFAAAYYYRCYHAFPTLQCQYHPLYQFMSLRYIPT
jgi:hypothetical protein